MQAFFENAQKGCNNTVISFTLTLRDQLEALIEIPTSNQIRSSMQASQESKIAIWEEVKVKSTTEVYLLCQSCQLMIVPFSVHQNNYCSLWHEFDIRVLENTSEYFRKIPLFRWVYS